MIGFSRSPRNLRIFCACYVCVARSKRCSTSNLLDRWTGVLSGSPGFWTVTVMVMHAVCSLCDLTLGLLGTRLGISCSVPQVIMLTFFLGTGGGELGTSSSVSLLLLLEVTFFFPFRVTGASSFSNFHCFPCFRLCFREQFDIPQLNTLFVCGKNSIC